MKKRILSLLLALALVVASAPFVMAAGSDRFDDVSGHWAESAIDRWSGYGVVNGAGGSFAPDRALTRGEAAQIFANLLGLTQRASLGQFTDVAAGSWYYDAIALCVAAGILTGTGDGTTMSPEALVSRQELFVMFARAMGLAPKATSSVVFTDSADVADWAAGYINALADMGAVSGSGDGSLAPTDDINRASFMALLDKSISGYGNTDGATVGGTQGIVLVVADNVTVAGNVEELVIAGGSAGVSGSTVGSVTVTGVNASLSVGGDAVVGSVNVTGANAAVAVSGQAQVSAVTVAGTAANTSVTVSGSAAVSTVDSAADNVSIAGDGTVGAANVSGDNTTVNTTGTDLTVAQGTTGVTENGNAVAGGSTVVTQPEAQPDPSQPVTPPVYVPTYYTVTYKVNGTSQENPDQFYTQAIAQGTVGLTAPAEVTAPEGQKVTWYDVDAQAYVDMATITVNSDLNLVAVIGSDDFTAGNGSKELPYLISNADELYAAGLLKDSQNHFELCADIDMNQVSETVSDKYGDHGDVGYIYGELNGANHTIRSKDSTDGTILYAVDAVIKNITFAGLTHTAVRNATNTTFENVTVNGSMEVGNNTGAFVVYAVPSSGEVTLTFNNCVADVEMTGPGAEEAYNAVFVGYAYGKGNKTTLNFTNCINNGDLTCGKAAMFLANDCGSGVVSINISNCINNGEIRSTFIANGYISNPFVAVGAHSQNTIVLDGKTLALGTDGYDGNVTVGDNGGFYQGPDDATLALVKNEDGTFTITAATTENVSSYKVTMSLYAKLLTPDGELEGGTMVVHVSETVAASAFADGKATTTLKHLAFVDEDWVDAHSDVQPTTEGGNTIYTVGGTSYYYFGTEDATSATLLGSPTMPTMISVSAYSADGALLCSANLSK